MKKPYYVYSTTFNIEWKKRRQKISRKGAKTQRRKICHRLVPAEAGRAPRTQRNYDLIATKKLKRHKNNCCHEGTKTRRIQNSEVRREKKRRILDFMIWWFKNWTSNVELKRRKKRWIPAFAGMTNRKPRGAKPHPTRLKHYRNTSLKYRKVGSRRRNNLPTAVALI